MLDTLRTFDTLKTGKLPEEQAHAVVQALQNAETDISRDWKGEILALRTELKTEFATKADLAVLRAELRADMRDLKSDLTFRMFLFWVGQFPVTLGLIFAAFKLFR